MFRFCKTVGICQQVSENILKNFLHPLVKEKLGSLKALAEHTGIPYNTLWNYARGARRLSPEIAEKLSKATGVPTKEILAHYRQLHEEPTEYHAEPVLDLMTDQRLLEFLKELAERFKNPSADDMIRLGRGLRQLGQELERRANDR
jgi:transcriptional regulator with XRE-family HTH domain